MNKEQIPDTKNTSEGLKNKLSKKRWSFKTRVIIFLLLILSVVSTSFYFYFQTTLKLKARYSQGIKYLETLNNEQGRCSDLLSQESGKFGDYEYCLQLLRIFPKEN